MIIDFYLYSQHEIANFKPVLDCLLTQGIDAAFIIERPGVHTAYGSRTDSKNDYKDDKDGEAFALVTDEIFHRITRALINQEIRFFTRGRYNADIVLSTQNSDWLHRYRSVKIRASYGVDSNDYEYSTHKNSGFDGVITHGPYSADLFSKHLPDVKVLKAGYPKYDSYFKGEVKKDELLKEWGISSDKRILSYFPTWAESSSLSWSVPAIVELAKNHTVIVKPHHNTLFFESDRLNGLRGNPNIFIISDAFDMSEFLSVSDVALCDITSGSYAEAIFAGVPVVAMHPTSYIYETKLPAEVYDSTNHAKSPESLISVFDNQDLKTTEDDIVDLLFESNREGNDATKFVNAIFEILANRLKVSEVLPKRYFPVSTIEKLTKKSSKSIQLGANLINDTSFRKFPVQLPDGTRYLAHNPDFAIKWLSSQSNSDKPSEICLFADDRFTDENHLVTTLASLSALFDKKVQFQIYVSPLANWIQNINVEFFNSHGLIVLDSHLDTFASVYTFETNGEQASSSDSLNEQIQPDLSVIIPTFNRLPVLKKCLHALNNQTLSPDKFEVIICDDGSEDDSVKWLKELETDFKLTVLEQDHKGPAIARNKAIDKARGNYAVFINDDTLLDPDALEVHLKLHHFLGDKKVAVLGRFDLLPEYTNTILGFLLQYTSLMFKYKEFIPDNYYDFNHFYTCNISVPLADIRKVGGFDEDFFIQAEDIELGFKLSKLSYSVYFSSEIQSWHDHLYTDALQLGKLAKNRANGAMILNAKHPEIGHCDMLDKSKPVQVKKNYQKRSKIIEQQLKAFSDLQLLDRQQMSWQQFHHIAANAQSLLFSIYGHFHDQGLLSSPHLKSIVARNEKSQREIKSPNTEKNLTSIIILNLNGYEHITKCVESILKNTKGEAYEIIVVDNGSDDGSLEYLESIPDLILISNPENVGAPYARNQAMALAKGEYLMFLDNDTILPPDWLPRLKAHFVRNPEVFILGPKSNYVSGDQIAPGANYSNYEELVAFSESLSQQNQGKLTQNYRLILYAMMVRREVVDKIGGYDPGYEKWGHEDDDYIIRANIAGFKTAIAHDVYVHHTGSQTEGKAKLNYQELLDHNRRYFLSKFGLDYDDFDPQIIPVKEMLANSFDKSRDITVLPNDEEIRLLIRSASKDRNPKDEQHLTEASFKNVSSDKDYFSLLVYKIKLNRLSEALEMTTERLKGYPDDLETLYYQANICYRLGKQDLAEQILINILQKKPDHIQSINNLAVIFWQKGEQEYAIKLMKNAVALDDRNIMSLENLADMLMASGDVDKAFEVYEKAYHENHRSITTLRQLGRIYDVRGQKIKAKYFSDVADLEEKLQLQN